MPDLPKTPDYPNMTLSDRAVRIFSRACVVHDAARHGSRAAQRASLDKLIDEARGALMQLDRLDAAMQATPSGDKPAQVSA